MSHVEKKVEMPPHLLSSLEDLASELSFVAEMVHALAAVIGDDLPESAPRRSEGN